MRYGPLTSSHSVTAHNSHLKTNYGHQRGGEGGVSAAAECRNLHREPSTQWCLVCRSCWISSTLSPPSCGVEEPFWGTFYPSYLQPWKHGRSDWECPRGWWSRDIWGDRCCRSNQVAQALSLECKYFIVLKQTRGGPMAESRRWTRVTEGQPAHGQPPTAEKTNRLSGSSCLNGTGAWQTVLAISLSWTGTALLVCSTVYSSLSPE